uniref:Uncharacterized protein n=1 Tax=Sphaerodactylus townsendi TaxID=933632 RepID=A0ACB8F244_9SAUR
MSSFLLQRTDGGDGSQVHSKRLSELILSRAEMASRRMTRETFDAVMAAKAKRYRLDRSDPIDEALHQLRVQCDDRLAL